MEIFVVGGAVRDELMGRVPKDIDYVVVGATADDMISLGYEQVGADFPVFLHPSTRDEYALARTERKTGNGYHGFAVDASPSTTLAADLSRRDLTINAMAKGEDGKIHDPFNGQFDLEQKILRHVSPAFAEDPLRVVRLARFTARYDEFTVANSTMDLAREIVENGELNHLPHERFWAELEKVFTEENAGRFFIYMDMFGAYEHVDFFKNLFPTVPKNHGKVFELAWALTDGETPAEDRVMFFTALMATESKTLWSAPVRTQKLYLNVAKLRSINYRSTENIFSIFSAAKVWSQAKDFSDLLDAMTLMEMTGEKLIFSPETLQVVADATRAVTAADFPGVEGKALGEAIQSRRKAVIDSLLPYL